MKNREAITQQCIYDLLMKVEKNAAICPIHAVVGLTRYDKIMRCYKYVNDGCEKCVQEWLNEET